MDKIIQGDCLEALKTLDSQSVQCCVTSPPYWRLRDYGVEGQIGLEDTPEEYVDTMARVFREIRRVLRDNGTCWLNLGDTYYSDFGGRAESTSTGNVQALEKLGRHRKPKHGILKQKDLVGIPWRVALALQKDGWWLRNDIIWHKPNPIPESVTDRCTNAHEYIFLLTKSKQYYYDHEAIKESCQTDPSENYPERARVTGRGEQSYSEARGGDRDKSGGFPINTERGRNKRDVWTVSTKPFPEAHFAVFPPELIRPCILAGCPEGETVLDPFAGAGTTLVEAKKQGCEYIGIELNAEYIEMIHDRSTECPNSYFSHEQ